MSIIDKIGMKSIKIVLAVIVSLLIGNLFKFESPYLTAINAMIATQSTIYRSVSFGKDRVLGTVIGSLIGIIIVTFKLNNFIIISIGVFIIIYACNLLNIKSIIVIAVTVCLSIVIFPAPNYNAINQTISTIMGVLIAIIVNLLLSPFEIISSLHKSYYDIKENIFSLYSKIFTAATNENIDLQAFNSKIMNFKALVEAYNKEYFKIQDKEIKFQQIETLFKNIDGISFFIAETIELRKSNLDDLNVSRINKLLHLDLKAFDKVKSQNNSLFNFHVDKLLNYLEIIESCQ